MQFTESQKSQLLMIGFIGTVLIVVVLYFNFVIGRNKVRTYEQQTAQVELKIGETKRDLSEIRELLAQEDLLEEQRQMIAKVTQRLPSQPDAPGFLMALVSIVRTTGIIQELVKPDKTIDRVQYTEIPYNIEAYGRYHELGQLLTLVEQNPKRFMRIKSVKLTTSLERPSIHPIELKISTFMFNN